MPVDLGSAANELESRVSVLEQRGMTANLRTPDVYLDPATGTTVIDDPLDWTVSPTGWESYSTISPIIDDPVDPNYPGGELSSDYGMAEAHLIGSMCVLTGMVRRKAGATPNPLAAGTRYSLPMFGLPDDWRPMHNVILPCLMGNADPTSASAVGTAWIEIRPEINPVLQPSGRVYFVTGTLSCAPSTGWVALQGVFPCQLLSST
jgi:hypothetical protein